MGEIMKILLNNIKIPIKHTDEMIIKSAFDILKGYNIDAGNLQIYRKSVDARRKNNIHYICAVIAELQNSDIKTENLPADIKLYEEPQFEFCSESKNKPKVLVAGQWSEYYPYRPIP
jgi:uncharacterized FAD-dependent dehydrogenase